MPKGTSLKLLRIGQSLIGQLKRGTWTSGRVKLGIKDKYAQGPTPHLAWKLATLAKQAMARKLKNIWDVWKTMVGFEMLDSVERRTWRKASRWVMGTWR